MHHPYMHYRLSSGHGHIHSGKMIFNQRIFPVPGRMAVNRRRIIPLGLASHIHPGQMGHSHRHPQGCLPVSLKLVPPEIKIPVGHTVKLADDAASSHLPGHALCLLRSGILSGICQHINSRKLKLCITAHGISHASKLAFQTALFHKMSCQHQLMFFAPCPQSACIVFCKLR